MTDHPSSRTVAKKKAPLFDRRRIARWFEWATIEERLIMLFLLTLLGIGLTARYMSLKQETPTVYSDEAFETQLKEGSP